jgi:adenylosuccinate synthase
MSKKVVVTSDLGGGDGGKGGVIDASCLYYNAHTIVKVGSPAGSHGITTLKGVSFNFSQFGCGTPDGIPTHISNLMLVEPIRFLMEGEKLEHEFGIRNVFDLVTLDERALCVTPFHTITSQLCELALKDKQKGTVGTGAGVAMLDLERGEEYAVKVHDIPTPELRKKLIAIREDKLRTLKPLIDDPEKSFWESDQKRAQSLITFLFDEEFIERIIGNFKEMYQLVKVVNEDYLYDHILSKEGTVVVESSNGILTDRYHGFHPFVSRLRTMPQRVVDMIKKRGYDGEVKILGITRAYQIRHGAGPMVTESSELLEHLLPGSNKDENRFQGRVRVGPLDFVALRYAIEACGGPEMFDGLAITWFDQIEKNGRWDICDEYIGADDTSLFVNSKRILVRHGVDEDQLTHQEKLGVALNKCRPVITSIDISVCKDKDDLIELCSQVFEEKLNLPVRMISFGPTSSHKVWLDKTKQKTTI